MRFRDIVSAAASGYCGILFLLMSWTALGEIVSMFFHGGWWSISFVAAFILMFTNNILDRNL